VGPSRSGKKVRRGAHRKIYMGRYGAGGCGRARVIAGRRRIGKEKREEWVNPDQKENRAKQEVTRKLPWKEVQARRGKKEVKMGGGSTEPEKGIEGKFNDRYAY